MPYRIRRDADSNEAYLETALSGRALLEDPLLNKGTAFTEQERRVFGLAGLLPPAVSSEQDQLARNYANYKSKTTDLERYQCLTALQDRNETLFYHLLSEHLTEMVPIIYTPVVGIACQEYSRIYHRPRGLYISIDQQDMLDELLAAVRRDVEVICVTDGERILGLGDLGIGGMGIPIGKLSLYTVCAGIHPATTLPIVLDVGTNNRELLEDPLYLGRRHERIRGDRYDAFMEAFVTAVAKRFPHAVLQWEDFAKNNAGRLLERYRDRLCSFNDDIQGTGAVTLAAVMAASAATATSIAEQRIVLLGAGSAAVGIATQLVIAMVESGLSPDAARAQICLIDSQGLVHDGREDLDAGKRLYAQPQALFSGSNSTIPSLLEVVRQVRPTVLIGAAAQPGAFDEQIVREMARHVEYPAIFPLSNPTSRCEALPEDLVRWTDARALIATGSPFAPVEYAGRSIPIPQCNNAFIFPGLGLGVLASGAARITDAMFVAAARALSGLSPALADASAPLLPTVEQVREASRHVALAVAREAERADLAPAMTDEELIHRIDEKMWTPRYLPYRRAS
ncbi:malate dehydrogenase [Steroidobacter denitrificans]|uniref:Malolactic enzyme n=1 Tax=Steroidobacter denitrificans TaxID=465721 RepID=A0A127F9E7_STEDE|nr:NAD-dependent malic enzyme [Steroidobacter denitrificans]AMN47044.1 malate dehydrogenase [Steroidobacter denitrificans]